MKRLLVLVVLLSSVPAFAHHSLVANYDVSRTMTLKGTVTRFEWTNPHCFIFIDVRNDKGEIENWALEGRAPGGLTFTGWRRDSVKPGDTISAIVFLPKAGVNVADTVKEQPQAVEHLSAQRLGHASYVILANGEKRGFGFTIPDVR